MLDYLQLYPETIEQVKRYSEAQRCRLYEAMAAYAFTGKEPSWPDDAPEWFIWESLRQQVERTMKKVNQNRDNAKGNKPERIEAKPSERKPTKANTSEPERIEAKPSETHNYDNESDTEKEKEIDNSNSSARAWVTDSEIADSLQRDQQIEESAKAWGLPVNEGQMIKARDLAEEYTVPWLLKAIETAGTGKEQTWRYVSGILKSWKTNGGPDVPKKQRASPAKTVSETQYTQRQYTEDQLLSVSDNLFAEVLKRRDTA